MAEPERRAPAWATGLGRAGLFLAGLLAVAAPLPRLLARSEPSPGRPSVVLLVVDDMTVEDLAHMPVLDSQLARRGIAFRNAFVTNSLCAPSRSSILTGLYAHNHGVLDNRPPIGGYRRFVEGGHEASNLAVWLRAAGYRTALVGKYINRYPGTETAHVPPGWDEWHALFSYESYWDYTMNENGRVRRYGDSDADYQTDVLKAKALAFIADAASAQPFFLYLAPFAPHDPALPATRHEEVLADLKAPRPPSFNEEDVAGKPDWVRGIARLDPAAVEQVDAWYRRRIRTLQAVDEMVGALLAALAERGRLDDTYVFFTSDNGYHLGSHRLSHSKGDAYEEAIRVPLLARGPGVPEGRTLDHMALNLDLAPTVAALAGAVPPGPVDGRSLVPLLGASPPPVEDWRHDALVEHWKGRGRGKDRDPDAPGEMPTYAALRTTDHLYVEYETGEGELYDLRRDPYELQNLYSTADRSLLKRLSERLRALRSCRGKSCSD